MTDFDITKHEIVPKHELLKPEEKEKVLKGYGITLRQLPRVLDTDPMSVHLQAKPGDVLRITRNSQTAGEYTYYRVVIKGAKK